MKFPDKYITKEVERKLTDSWQKEGIYKWDPNKSRDENFSIDTPPPTVSGALHMGHIFSYTQTDFIARYQRMIGKNVFYPMGFDDNGLPTERLVEKVKKIRASKLPRSEFIKLCEEVVADSEKGYRETCKDVALSVDWDQEYQTINAKSRKISQMSFLDLFNKKLLERKYAPTFWDCIDLTAIAQAEIEDKEKQGYMHYIAFESIDGESLTIATTRPEMIPGCVALLYHPEDSRYKHLSNKKALTPIFNHQVPIIPDEAVEPEKGSGLVMCCTFGDIQDVEWWKKHKLPVKNIINIYGKLENSGKYDGLKVSDAREIIVKDLATKLIRTEEVTQFVKCAERSGAALEIIATYQWYIKVLDYKDQLINQSKKCNWYPKYMEVRLENWINGLNQDWCISRQRYFGVPFPVWYSKRAGEEGKILLPEIDQLPIDPLTDLPKGYTKEEVEPDKDVMDTWATSAVSPQLNSLAINKDLSIDYERHKKLFPFDLRPQGHEIIRTWGFYTLVKSMQHESSIPWKNLMISGWCLASDKTKMSKSKGNVVTPHDLIAEKGADVVRYWASTSKLGADTAYSEELMKIGKKLVTKLWNASKFCAMHIANINGSPGSIDQDYKNGIICETLDIYILSRLSQTLSKANKFFTNFEYCDARCAVEDFFWNDFCDFYLECIKTRIYNEENDFSSERQSAIYTIYHCISTILKLFAPFIPYVTDEIYRIMFEHKSIHRRGNWPKFSFDTDEEIQKQGKSMVELVNTIRKFKSDHNISLRAELNNVFYSGTRLSSSIEKDLKGVSNTRNIYFDETLGENLNVRITTIET